MSIAFSKKIVHLRFFSVSNKKRTRKQVFNPFSWCTLYKYYFFFLFFAARSSSKVASLVVLT